MSQDKRRTRAKPTEPLNNPFVEARERLKGLVAKAKAVPVIPSPPTPLPKGEGRRPEDDELFRQEMAGVVPLQQGPSRKGERAPRAPSDRQAPPRLPEEAEVYAQLADLVLGSGTWDIADTDEYIEGLAPGLDRRLLQRLHKGDYAVQAHLDLHGLTSEEARGRVERFIADSRAAGRRCVLIIHGRGLNSKDQIPILKERLRVWLARGRISRSVLCFATAQSVDGGAGAVYVLLRK